MRSMLRIMLAAGTLTVLGVGPALACGGLVAPNGAVNLVRTTTLAAYVDGIEHYVTSFEFSGGGGGKFGSIVPLPAVPTEVSKAGRWTLQRLVDEVSPPLPLADLAAVAEQSRSGAAEVLLETRVSALDITVLKGGGDEVGEWAKENGFSLPPDAPEVLDFYAERSPIFMAVRFNLARAEKKDIGVGDGVPVHVTVPTDQPWVPLRILGLGRSADETVEADVFLLTENRPAVLPAPELGGDERGLLLERSGPASELLLADLRSDRGMEWLPSQGMWLDYIRINELAGALDHDLAINVNGGSPSLVDAGLTGRSDALPLPDGTAMVWPWVVAAVVGVGALTVTGKLASRRS